MYSEHCRIIGRRRTQNHMLRAFQTMGVSSRHILTDVGRTKSRGKGAWKASPPDDSAACCPNNFQAVKARDLSSITASWSSSSCSSLQDNFLWKHYAKFISVTALVLASRYQLQHLHRVKSSFFKVLASFRFHLDSTLIIIVLSMLLSISKDKILMLYQIHVTFDCNLHGFKWPRERVLCA